jgi:hypothetical protein
VAESPLLERERSVSELVRRYASGREAAAEVFVLDQARTDFSELLSTLREAKSQAGRLRDRGIALALPTGNAIAALVRRFVSVVEADVGAVAERADAYRAVRQYVQTYEAEVRDATRAHVDQARSGVDRGLVDLLRQTGLQDSAARLDDALTKLLTAAQELPESDDALDEVDRAAAEVRAVMSALDDPAHARLLEFVRRLVASGGSVSLDTLDSAQLDDPRRSGAAKNFIVSARSRT